MSYIYSNLMNNEVVIYEGRLSVWALTKWLVPGAVMMCFIFSDAWWGNTMFSIGVGLMTVALIIYGTTEMAVTSQRVISKTGWIARKTTEISLARVEGVEVNQTIVQRLLDYGHILVSGVGSHKAKIAGVSEPLAFRKAFLEALTQFEQSIKSPIAEKMDHTEAVVKMPDVDAESGIQTRIDTKSPSKPIEEPKGEEDVGMSMEEELAGLVTCIAGEWVIADKWAFIDFLAKWRGRDNRVLSLIELNEHSQLLSSKS